MRITLRKVGMTLMTIISRDANYSIIDEQHVCCDAVQFRYKCNKCEEYMDCYYCGFDYTKPHDCEPEI